MGAPQRQNRRGRSHQGLSPEARAYFAAGGLGILIGDGALNYRPEKILETYYSYSLNNWASLTFDYQFVADPAYNADRGPVPHFFRPAPRTILSRSPAKPQCGVRDTPG